ncbi:sorting nexin-9-like isoform X2 [Hemiscyllium ocellatum]|uniref:sorting nexin-9-like isoform X2 n=1 Tax=Hemiscyllium ocellatum TaxID=170820 RepID=UPI002966AFC4|nr:sorting nexin-9-like isoform X2 [Hemiscyllium ocellatum]
MSTKAIVRCIFKRRKEGELTLIPGEVITVNSQDIYSGWYEGMNSNGEYGLFPGQNVELLMDSVPAIKIEETCAADSHYEEIDVVELRSKNSYSNSDTSVESIDQVYEVITHEAEDKRSSNESTPKRITRLYHFTKTEAEPFIAGKTVKTATKIKLTFNENGASWVYPIVPLECTITNPQIETKYSGMKKYISYQITPNDTNISVYHRYKHFDWLYCRLIEKFGSIIPIPLLPEKDIPWRYSDDFVQARMGGLQAWINRISRHPIISHSEIFQHFIRRRDEKDWKSGKRNAEKDEAVGGMIFSEIMPSSEFRLLNGEEPEKYLTFAKCMGESVRSLITVTEEHMARCTGSLKSEYIKIGKAFSDISASFAKSTYLGKESIGNALAFVGKTYDDIGNVYFDQPKQGVHCLLEISKEYKGLLACFPDIINILKGAIEKAHEYEKLAQVNKVTMKEKEAIVFKAGVVSSTIQAEINHFNRELTNDYKETIQHFLYEQVQMYSKITDKLREAYARFEF